MIYQMVCIDVRHSVLCKTDTEVSYTHFQRMSVCRWLTLLTLHSYSKHAYPQLNVQPLICEILNLVHLVHCLNSWTASRFM